MYPNWKRINDCYKTFIAGHRVVVACKAKSSGIIEVSGEREILLEDVTQEADELDENIDRRATKGQVWMID